MSETQTPHFETTPVTTWQIESVTPEAIPAAVASDFLRQNIMLNDAPAQSITDFEQLFRVDSGDGVITFAALDKKTYSTNGTTERLLYLFDQDTESSQELGIGEVRLSISDQREYFKDKPFVGWTETRSDFLEHGYGQRRLRVMNAISVKVFGLELNSDTNMAPAAQHLWEKLVEQGEATQYLEGENIRFRFLPSH